MAFKNLPSIEDLRKFLRYVPETGKLYWNYRNPQDFLDGKKGQIASCNTWNGRFGGKEALTTLDFYGYFGGRFHRQAIKAHRAAFAIYHGRWPDGDVDHINGDRGDNRIENLRDCTRQQNLANRHVTIGTSCYRGVSWSTESKQWVVWCSKDNKGHFGGRFGDEVVAAVAFDRLAKKLHGEYAKLNFPE